MLLSSGEITENLEKVGFCSTKDRSGNWDSAHSTNNAGFQWKRMLSFQNPSDEREV